MSTCSAFYWQLAFCLTGSHPSHTPVFSERIQSASFLALTFCIYYTSRESPSLQIKETPKLSSVMAACSGLINDFDWPVPPMSTQPSCGALPRTFISALGYNNWDLSQVYDLKQIGIIFFKKISAEKKRRVSFREVRFVGIAACLLAIKLWCSLYRQRLRDSISIEQKPLLLFNGSAAGDVISPDYRKRDILCRGCRGEAHSLERRYQLRRCFTSRNCGKS